MHIASFMAVTGPKTDLWLVEAFGLLVASFGLVLLYAAVYGRLGSLLKLAAFAVAGALTFIDAYYVYRGEISRIYLADGVFELCVALAWLWLSVGRSERAERGHLNAEDEDEDRRARGGLRPAS